jgi:hypothetical protein
MENKIRIVTFMVVAFPLFYMMVGAQIAHADNESSYKHGYQEGKSEWHSCASTDGEGDCSTAHDSCVNTVYYRDNITGQFDIPYHWEVAPGVDNVTACIHGYVHSWNKVCDLDKGNAREEKLTCPLPESGIPN